MDVESDAKELIKEMKDYRDGMVARNFPFQWISDIITKWEMKKVSEKTFHPRAIDGYSE